MSAVVWSVMLNMNKQELIYEMLELKNSLAISCTFSLQAPLMCNITAIVILPLSHTG